MTPALDPMGASPADPDRAGVAVDDVAGVVTTWSAVDLAIAAP